jgi:hypothetical protein
MIAVIDVRLFVVGQSHVHAFFPPSSRFEGLHSQKLPYAIALLFVGMLYAVDINGYNQCKLIPRE